MILRELKNLQQVGDTLHAEGSSCKQRTVQALPKDAIMYVCAYKVHIEGSTLATPHTVLGVAPQGYTADSSIDARL